MEAGEPGILITYGFLNRWYFTGSISSPGSGFTGWIGALVETSERSAGRFCGKRSCLTRGKLGWGGYGGVDGGEEWKGTRWEQELSLHFSHSVSHSPTLSDWYSLFSVNELPGICS